jgi:hypothetical protein
MNRVVVTPAKLASSTAAAHASPDIRKSVYSPDLGRRIHHRRGISGANESDDPSGSGRLAATMLICVSPAGSSSCILRQMTSSGRVLVVDGEPLVRELLRDYLTTWVMTWPRRRLAPRRSRWCRSSGQTSPLVDMVMPGMAEVELLDAPRGTGVTIPL